MRQIKKSGVRPIARALAIQAALLAVAVANGALQTQALESRLGALAAHAASTLTLCASILLLTYAAIGWIAPSSPRLALAIGLLWAALTVGFEFGLGRFFAHTPWPELVADDDLIRGRLWILVPIVLAAAPYAAARLRELA